MSFISPALISRIYQALGRNRASDAILLLRQHSFGKSLAHDNELMLLIVKLADQCLLDGDLVRAEEHFRLGMALYDYCFHERKVEALRCASGLVVIYDQQKRVAESISALGLIDEISKSLRASVAVQIAQAV